VWGWYGFFVALGVCGLVAVSVLIPLWNIKSNPNFTTPDPTLGSVEPEAGLALESVADAVAKPMDAREE
jgi:hypothetical protein